MSNRDIAAPVRMSPAQQISGSTANDADVCSMARQLYRTATCLATIDAAADDYLHAVAEPHQIEAAAAATVAVAMAYSIKRCRVSG